MSSLFGIPMGTLLVVCSLAFGLSLVTVAVLAIRNRVFFRLGIRHAPRRPGRTALIVFGLMLGTLIISAAFSTGDTMTHTIRTLTLKALGDTDETISVRQPEIDEQFFLDTEPPVQYLDQALFPPIAAAARDTGLVDGVAPAIIETVAVQDVATRQNEPRVTIFATDPAQMSGFGAIRSTSGGVVSLRDIGPGEIYLNDFARDELRARPGDELRVFAAGREVKMRVKDIVTYDGAGTSESAALLPLAAAQELLGRDGQIKYILVSNQGNALAGAARTDAVIAALQPMLDPLGLEANPSKQDALDLAEQAGNAFLTVFTAFGVFSIIAGFMLIFLIFVMLAAERKTEMGIARAVGTQRGHLVQMFLFEGVLYDLVAAAVGALLGLAVAYGMVFVMAQAFATFGIDIEHDLRLRSLAIAYMLGMLLTFVVVAGSAWRVSLLNIVSAIRDLPDPITRGGSGLTLALGVIAAAVGVLMTVGGLNSRNGSLFNLGISLCVIALVPLLRRLRFPDRGSYTIPGIALVVWWLLPWGAFDFILPEFKSDISIFIFGGVIVVIGAIWVVVYNSDLIVQSVTFLFGRFRLLAPALKAAMAYPLMSRFRTGLTMAMFTLIVFTLVVMATVNNAFLEVFNNEEAFGGGFDIRATTVRANPLPDVREAIEASPTLNAGDFGAIGSQSVTTIEARQLNVSDQKFNAYPLRGLDSAFLQTVTYDFSIMARGYNSPREVWDALAANPDFVVVDDQAVPTHDNFDPGAAPVDFQLEGFYSDDPAFDPVDVEIRDAASGRTRTVTVIAVLKFSSGPLMFGISGAQAGVVQLLGPEQAAPVVHFLQVRDGADAAATAAALESAFLDNGMEASSLGEELDKLMATQLTFNYLLQGFMGLGLVVGVTALGVVSARAVVERRQQIGVLRAIGFQRWMVQLVFLLESSFIAILSIGVGLILGLVISFNVIDSEGSATQGISFAVPWLNLGVIFAITYVVAVAATLLPARQAASVLPAEALRYE